MKYFEISNKSKEEIYIILKTDDNGLSTKEANKRLEENGLNIVVENKKRGPIYFLLNSFKDKFILILLILAIIDLFNKDYIGTAIIIGLGIMSALISFAQNYSTYRFNERLKSKMKNKTTVLRNKFQDTVINTENVVVGDIITLSAGSIVPADMILLESKDLFVNQSAFTGESIPVEKRAFVSGKENDDVFNIPNICLKGSNVISGKGLGAVITTGFDTYLGKMNKEISKKKEPTNYTKEMDSITKLLIRCMIIVSISVFLLFGLLRGNWGEAFLFALSVAVGITPSMLPMIVNVNLTKGSKSLEKKKTLVKNIKSIQNLGTIDVLCTDKTGTLTQDKIELQKYIDVNGKEDLSILKYAYVNSYLGTGLKNIVDRAIISFGKENKVNIDGYEKVDEIPFDYTRKRMSIVVKKEDYTLITKGALEEILKVCTKVRNGEKIEKLNEKNIDNIQQKAKELARKGMQVIAIASKKEYSGINIFSSKDENNMTFIGLVGFLDPPKKDVKETIKKLKKYGIETKVITGDNPYATENICSLVGIESESILLGTELEKMTDEELSEKVEKINIFARMNPMQKERIVKTLRNNGHVVGYMGDGVNDAGSLHSADVGICVNTGADIAKESSDIILLEKSLKVILDGVLEGRKVYANIEKYMKLAISSDFGDVFSILIASIFLPFLPLLPIQMLIQDFLFQFSQIAIPYDSVDPEYIQKPRKWNTKNLGRFMVVMGMTSSVIDIIAFILFWFVLGYNSIEKEAYFQTAWFIECLISQTLIIHFIRTEKIPFIESRASKPLMIMSLVTILGTIIVPFILNGVAEFNFVILPIKFYIIVLLLNICYTIIAQIVKKLYIRKYHEWL